MIQRPVHDRTYYHSLQITDLPAVGAPASVGRINIEEESYVMLTKLLAIDDSQSLNLPCSAYGVQIEQEGAASWFSDFVNSDLIFGLGANPRKLPMGIPLPPNSVLNVKYKPTGLTASYNRFDVALEGIKKPAMTDDQYMRLRQRPYFVYATPFARDFVAGATELNLDFEISADANFVVRNLCGSGIFNNSGGSISQWNAVNVQIINLSDNDRSYFKKPIGWFQAFGQPDVWCGPNRLMSPMVFLRKARIRVQLTVDTTIGTLTNDWKSIQIGFEGYKIKD